MAAMTTQIDVTGTVNHVHKTEPAAPKVNVSMEKNSRGTNLTLTVTGAQDFHTALNMIREARQMVKESFGDED